MIGDFLILCITLFCLRLESRKQRDRIIKVLSKESNPQEEKITKKEPTTLQVKRLSKNHTTNNVKARI